ncbi:hypothetical protein K439DRAFT_1520610 [Ramaria rubella]|nr:hypothetical protein K439DRAFT_1520610 [Ramaria rubella]
MPGSTCGGDGSVLLMTFCPFCSSLLSPLSNSASTCETARMWVMVGVSGVSESMRVSLWYGSQTAGGRVLWGSTGAVDGRVEPCGGAGGRGGVGRRELAMCTCIRACVRAGTAAVGTAWGVGHVGMQDRRAGRVQLGTIGGATAAGIPCVVKLRQGTIVRGHQGKGGDIDMAQHHGVWVYTELSSSIQSSAVCNVDKAIAIWSPGFYAGTLLVEFISFMSSSPIRVYFHAAEADVDAGVGKGVDVGERQRGGGGGG